MQWIFDKGYWTCWVAYSLDTFSGSLLQAKLVYSTAIMCLLWRHIRWPVYLSPSLSSSEAQLLHCRTEWLIEMPLPHASCNTVVTNYTSLCRALDHRFFFSFFLKWLRKRAPGHRCDVWSTALLALYSPDVTLESFPESPASSTGRKKYGTYSFYCTLLAKAAKTSGGKTRAQLVECPYMV